MNVNETLKLELGERSYEIQIGHGLLSSAGEKIRPHLAQDRAVIITDENVAKLYLDVLKKSLVASEIRCDEIILPAGEQTKNFDFLQKLIGQLLDLNVERGTTLLALGGGVIGDLAGFAAAILLRGIDFIQIPTTLLSQVDSSVGGKTGINTRHGKNLVGAFYQPKLVLADIDSLDSLGKREILAGYAEVAKYGLINNASIFEWLEDKGSELCEGNGELRRQAVIMSCQIKAKIVSSDERESGDRVLLNLGHTFGHALEAEAGFANRLLHGEAVAIGICLAFDFSLALGLCNIAEVKRVRTHFNSVGLPSHPKDVFGVDWNIQTLIQHMKNDKKVKNGYIRFILARGIGQAFVTDVIAMDNISDIFERITQN